MFKRLEVIILVIILFIKKVNLYDLYGDYED